MACNLYLINHFAAQAYAYAERERERETQKLYLLLACKALFNAWSNGISAQLLQNSPAQAEVRWKT